MKEELLKTLTVLYAEDDPVMLASMTNTLSLLVTKTIATKNGAEAIKAFAENTVHIVILDIDMPIMNGLDVAAEIRKTDKSIPIFILTNYEDTQNLKQAVKLNLVDFLSKPIDFTTLRNTLDECINRLNDIGNLKITIGGNVYYDSLEKATYQADEKIILNKKELSVIELLIKKRGSVVSYETIENIIGADATKDAVKGLMARLRKKIGKEYIKNVWEVGYFLA